MTRHPFKESESAESRIRAEQLDSALATVQELGKLLDDNDSSASANESLEYDEGIYLAALREDIRLLGGELEVKAIFPGQTVKLTPASQD